MLPLLDGFRVLDLCRLAVGATTKLADLGAEVIKVEEPPHGDMLRALPPIVERWGVGLFYVMINRNKKSVAIDLRSEEGRAILCDLVRTADAVVELSRPGAWERLGLGYEDLRAVKPDLVYCSITGYGQTGPYRDLPSHSMNVDAAAGLLRVTRAPGRRPEITAGSALGLEMASAHGALGVVAALLARSRTGAGRYLDVSFWDGAVAFNVDFQAALNLGSASAFENPLAGGGPGPKYNVYGTKDDKVLLICPIERRFWSAFCTTVGRQDWVERGRVDLPMDYGESDPALRDDIEAVMRSRTADEWMEALLAAGVPVSPVLDADELVGDPHVAARAMVTGTDDARYGGAQFVRPPLVVGGAEFSIRMAAPAMGEHTHEVLAELGYDDARRARLLETRIIAAS